MIQRLFYDIFGLRVRPLCVSLPLWLSSTSQGISRGEGNEVDDRQRQTCVSCTAPLPLLLRIKHNFFCRIKIIFAFH